MLIISALCIIAIAGIDQLIKMWVMSNMSLYEERDFLKIGSLDLMHLHYIENTGSAFSSFSGQRAFLLIITVIGVGICCYFLIKNRKEHKPLLHTSLTMILGGAIGNMIDRIFHGGAVVDYLDVQLFNFAIFNFADCFITVGTILLAIHILFFMEDDKNPNHKEVNHDNT
mgnify:FL=1